MRSYIEVRSPAIAAAVLMFLAAMAWAGTVEYNIECNSVEHFFVPPDPDPILGGPGTIIETFVKTAGMPPLTADFSQDKTLVINLSAPQGQAFQLRLPAGATSPSFNIRINSDYAMNYPFYDGNAEVQWNVTTGDGPAPFMTTLSNAFATGYNGGSFGFNLYMGITDSFDFTSVTITVAVPDEFTKYFISHVMYDGSIGIAASTTENTDPGSLIELVPLSGCTEYLASDLNKDCTVDYLDIVFMAGQWLQSTLIN